MATQPPPEFPTPGNDTDIPDGIGHEIDMPGPDVDIPAPQPAGDPGTQMGFDVTGASTAVGTRESGDKADIGSTDGMGASTGGLAGTSR